MAGNIKGITLEIGGTTTKLTQALKEPQKESMALRSKLKDVNAALKFDTKNVDLLRQKQEIVTKSISSTESELKLLKQAQEEYKNSGKDLNSDEYIALEKKIALTERALENLRGQQSNFNSELQAMGLKIGEFGEKTEALGKKFLPVTAGVAAVGTAATAAWSELDEAYDGIAAGTGATGDALEDLQQSFDNVYGNFPAESADVSTAIADINTRFGLSGKTLEDASIKFLKYAQVNNVDVSGSIENVAKAMYDAGIPTEELGTVLDKLTVASQASGLPVDQLSEALSKNGVNMRELGYSTDETIALLTTFEKKGVDTGTVLTGMKAAVKNCAKEGTDAKVEMANMFEAIENGSATAADAQALFGAKAGAAIFNYASEGKLNITDMMAAIDGSAGGLDATFEAMQDPADKMTVALNNLKIAGADLGDAIQQTLAPLIEKLADACKKAAEWFGNLTDSQKELTVKLGLAAAAIGPVLIAVGKLSKGVSAMITYFGTATTVGGKLLASIKSLWAGLSIGVAPLMAIVAAVAAVVGAFVTLWNNNEEFRNRMVEIWNQIVGRIQEFFQGITERINQLGFDFDNIVEVIKAIWQGFCDFLAPIFEGVWNNIAIVIDTALDTIMGIIDFFISMFKGDWQGCWDAVSSIASGIWEGIIGIFQNVLNTLKGALDTVLGWFGTSWEECWGNISTFFTEVWAGIQTVFTDVWNAITTFVTEVWNNISTTCTDIWNGISTFISGLLTGIQTKFSEIWNGIKTFVTATWDGIKTTCTDVWNGIKKAISDPIENAKKTVSDVMDSIKAKCSDVWNGIKTTCTDVWNGIKRAISDPIDNAKKAVGDAIDAIKGFFNFNFQWPHLPLPHFAIHPPGWKIGDLLKGKIPTLGIDWYAKAMDAGMILTRPTIFGMGENGQLLAGGEAGSEAVVGVQSLRQMIDAAVNVAASRYVRPAASAPIIIEHEIDYGRLAESLVASLSSVQVKNTVNVGGQRVVDEILPLIDRGLAKQAKRR